MDLNSIAERITHTNGKFGEEAQQRLDSLTKPQGSLGRLEEFAKQLVAITEQKMPDLDKKVIFTFAGDHGVAEEGVSAFPKEVTPQMVLNFVNGGAGINVLARHAGADVVAVDIGVDYDFGDLENAGFVSRKIVSGTNNMRKGPAMTRDEAVKCIEVGMALATEYAEKGYKIFGTGDMGIANTTPSSAITAVLTGKSVEDITGRGTGINDEALNNKVKVIKDAIELNKPDATDAVDVLAKVGGAEIGGIAGLILGAAANKVPVVVDGFISTAGALIAYSIDPKTRDYMFAAHQSQEIGHTAMLDKMGLRPIIDLDLRLGEGTGAALAMILIEAGLKIYKEMATFEEAAVSNKGELRAQNPEHRLLILSFLSLVCILSSVICNLMRKLILAFQFLTIIPVKDTGEIPDDEMGSVAVAFPVVGLAEGAVLTGLAFLLLKILPAEVVSALLVLVMTILNGGLHLDGLADTFDAIAARGDSKRKLSIMKDSSIGPAGVISIVIVLLLTYVLLNAVHFHASKDLYFGIVLLMPVVSRWAMVPALYYGKPAKQNGLGKLFIEFTGLKELIFSTLLMFLMVILYALIFSNIDLFVSFCMMNFPVLYAFCLLTVWFSNIHFEGLTGDVLGAVNEIAKLLFLITSLLWLQQST